MVAKLIRRKKLQKKKKKEKSYPVSKRIPQRKTEHILVTNIVILVATVYIYLLIYTVSHQISLVAMLTTGDFSHIENI